MDAPSDKPERTDSEYYALSASLGEQASFCFVNFVVFILYLFLLSLPLQQLFNLFLNDTTLTWSFAVGIGIIGASYLHLISLKKIS